MPTLDKDKAMESVIDTEEKAISEVKVKPQDLLIPLILFAVPFVGASLLPYGFLKVLALIVCIAWGYKVTAPMQEKWVHLSYLQSQAFIAMPLWFLVFAWILVVSDDFKNTSVFILILPFVCLAIFAFWPALMQNRKEPAKERTSDYLSGYITTASIVSVLAVGINYENIF